MSARLDDDDVSALEAIAQHMMETFPGTWPTKTTAIKWAIHRTRIEIDQTPKPKE